MLTQLNWRDCGAVFAQDLADANEVSVRTAPSIDP